MSLSTVSPAWLFVSAGLVLLCIFFLTRWLLSRTDRVGTQVREEKALHDLDASEEERGRLHEENTRLHEQGQEYARERARHLERLEAGQRHLLEELAALAETCRTFAAPATLVRDAVWSLQHEVLPGALSLAQARLLEDFTARLFQALDEQARLLDATLATLPEQVAAQLAARAPRPEEGSGTALVAAPPLGEPTAGAAGAGGEENAPTPAAEGAPPSPATGGRRGRKPASRAGGPRRKRSA